MKKSSKKPSKKENKEAVKNEDLKNISGGEHKIPIFNIDPAEIRRILDERMREKNKKE